MLPEPVIWEIGLAACAFHGICGLQLPEAVPEIGAVAAAPACGSEQEEVLPEPVIWEIRLAILNGGYMLMNFKWLCCPHCRQKIARVYDDTVLRNMPLYCKKCHRESLFDFSVMAGVSMREAQSAACAAVIGGKLGE